MKENLRDELIQNMFESLYREGYHASNIDRFLKKMETSKGSMYYHFKSKKELALESIRIAGEGFVTHFWAKTLQENDNPIFALEQLLKTLPQTIIMGDCAFDFQYGCPINNLVQEMSALDEEFRALLASILKKWIKVISKHLKKAQENGILHQNFDPEAVAHFIVASIEGCLTLAKVHQSQASYEKSTHILIEFLRTLEL